MQIDLKEGEFGAFNEELFHKVLRRRNIVIPSFSIYGSERGLYDLGPVGSSVLRNINDIWYNHFCVRDSLLNITATCLTPERVLKASGHVDRFTDLMVKDDEGNFFRADKLLENHIEEILALLNNPKKDSAKQLQILNPQNHPIDTLTEMHTKADAYSIPDLHSIIQSFNIKSPKTQGVLTEPRPFNLMFPTYLGPSGSNKAFLRPETAQGMFVNFKQLLASSNGKLPFGAAQQGLGFRNEISPRGGLIRVREFPMAEIEFFVDPEKKTHTRFGRVKDEEVVVWTKEAQLSNKGLVSMTVGDAVAQGVVANEVIGYYIARAHQFLMKVGVDPERVRFRQHLETQMAHYASDCWDAEIYFNNTWVECAGLADRGCYDLSVHSEASAKPLTVSETLDVPQERIELKPAFNRQAIGKAFKADGKVIIPKIESICSEDDEFIAAVGENGKPEVDFVSETVKLSKDGELSLQVDDKEFKLDSNMVTFERVTKVIRNRTFIPHVIEPSFGMGRILNAVLEHSFYVRAEDVEETEAGSEAMKRSVFKFPVSVASTKVALVPLFTKPDMLAKMEEIMEIFQENGIPVEVEASSASIGRRYTRCDEIGIPFAITIDHQTLEGQGVTLRERDSTSQIRIPEDDVLFIMEQLSNGRTEFAKLQKKFKTL